MCRGYGHGASPAKISCVYAGLSTASRPSSTGPFRSPSSCSPSSGRSGGRGLPAAGQAQHVHGRLGGWIERAAVADVNKIGQPAAESPARSAARWPVAVLRGVEIEVEPTVRSKRSGNSRSKPSAPSSTAGTPKIGGWAAEYPQLIRNSDQRRVEIVPVARAFLDGDDVSRSARRAPTSGKARSRRCREYCRAGSEPASRLTTSR